MSTWPDWRAVKNWLLVSGTSFTSEYAMPACLRARSRTTPWAWPCEKASFLPLKPWTSLMSLPGLVAKR